MARLLIDVTRSNNGMDKLQGRQIWFEHRRNHYHKTLAQLWQRATMRPEPAKKHMIYTKGGFATNLAWSVIL